MITVALICTYGAVCLTQQEGDFSEGIFEDVSSRYSVNVCKKLYLAYTDRYGKYFFLV